MRRSLMLPLAATTLLALAGCVREPDPTDLGGPETSVHAVLEAGADSAVVLIVRPSFGPGSTSAVPVSGAEVRLIADGGEVWLTEDPGSPCESNRPGGTGAEGEGCYRARLGEPIAPGDVYRLDITLPDGTRVTGETTVPAPPIVTAPTVDARVVAECLSAFECFGAPSDVNPYVIPVATIPIAWTAGPQVASIRIALRPTRVYHDGVEHPGGTCSLGYAFGPGGPSRVWEDSARWAIPNIVCGIEGGSAIFDSIRADVIVVGLEDAYATYEEGFEGDTVRERSASEGLEGAFGVFGAVAEARRSVMIVRDPPPASP